MLDSWDDIEHLAIILGVILTLLGIVKGVFEVRKMIKAWQEARDEAIAARVRHEDALKLMMTEFRSDHGESLRDKVDEGNREIVTVKGTLDRHVKTADKWFEDNNIAHKAINDRVDGMFEMLATPLNQHRLEEEKEKS